MKIYESIGGMYDFKYLPAFASWLLKNHLTEFAEEQLRLSRSFQLPMLKHLTHYSDADLHRLGMQSVGEFLQLLASNNARQQLTDSLIKWQQNNLEIISKFQISAEDITVLYHIRGKLFRHFLKLYPVENDVKMIIVEEVETFIMGGVTSATNVLIDIVKDKLMEESHLNNRLINTSPGIIFIYDLEAQREVYVNGNVTQIMGYTPEEVLNMGNIIGTLTHPGDLNALQAHLEEIIRDTDDKSYSIEYRFLHKDGKYRWLRSYHLVFKRDEAGKPLQVLGTTFEITLERETRAALKKSQEQLLEAQAITHVGSFEWDMIADRSENSPELARIFELGENESHASFMNLVHPDDREMVERSMQESFKSGKYECQYRYIKHGKLKYIWSRGVVQFQEGRPHIMRGTVQDITELKRIEGELMQKTLELQRSNENLERFASIASHDLKEPLRKMSMYSDMVLISEKGKISEASTTNLEKVKRSSIRLTNMIGDILNFSTINAHDQATPVDLNEVVNEAKSLLEEVITERAATIITDDLPVMRVHRSQFRQVFQNLINNSIKFAREGVPPEITITHAIEHEQGKDWLTIKVTDNGIGFETKDAEKIFELFTRLHGRGTYEGNGLGLSICKRIIENHGGNIKASSTGTGATFSIRLPINP